MFSVFSEEKNGNKILVKLQLWELIQSMSWCSKIKAQKKKIIKNKKFKTSSKAHLITFWGQKMSW